MRITCTRSERVQEVEVDGFGGRINELVTSSGWIEGCKRAEVTLVSRLITTNGGGNDLPHFLKYPLKKKKKNYLFKCARSLLWHVGSNSLIRDQTQAPCTGSVEF